MTLLSYAVLKGEILLSRLNPTVATVNEENYLDETDKLNLHDAGIRVAFEVSQLNGDKSMDDWRYLKYIARIKGKEAGNYY